MAIRLRVGTSITRGHSERGASINRSKCGGPDGAPICYCKFVAQSTTERSVPGLGIDLTGSPMQTRPLRKRHDPDSPTTGPILPCSITIFSKRVGKSGLTDSRHRTVPTAGGGARWGIQAPVMSRISFRRSALDRGSPKTKPRSCRSQPEHGNLLNRCL
jgi:hypothetical protein